jgi:hypothetical protein
LSFDHRSIDGGGAGRLLKRAIDRSKIRKTLIRGAQAAGLLHPAACRMLSFGNEKEFLAKTEAQIPLRFDHRSHLISAVITKLSRFVD